MVRQGFTLVEILAVVVILGITSALVIPNVGARNDQYTQAAARVVMADLIYAQNRAIVTQTMQYVTFDAAGQNYSLLSGSPATTPLAYLPDPTSLQNYQRQFGSPASAALQNAALQSASFDGKTTLAFDELGAPYAWDPATNTATPLMASGTIVLGSGTFSMTVWVEPYTGNLTVQ